MYDILYMEKAGEFNLTQLTPQTADALRLRPLPVCLSPMAGFTNAPARVMALRFGADAVYTEMAGVEGLIHEHSEMTWQLLETLPEEEGKVYAHLYGSDPDHFAKAAEMIAKTGRFIGIDINAGCPVPKVTRGGAGSALMREPEKVRKIIEATRKASGLPVSLKTRIGYHPKEETIHAIAEAAEAGGAAQLSIHGRYKSQGHAGEVNHALIAGIKRQAKIPIFGNGGIRSVEDTDRFFNGDNVDGVLVGQATIGHPWIFKEIKERRTFEPSASHSAYLDLEEIHKRLIEHLDMEYAHMKYIFKKYPTSAPDSTPLDITIVRFRCHLFRYLTGLRGASYMRGRMANARTLEDCHRAIDGCLECERRFRLRHRNYVTDS